MKSITTFWNLRIDSYVSKLDKESMLGEEIRFEVLGFVTAVILVWRGHHGEGMQLT